jgi:YceI-like domain
MFLHGTPLAIALGASAIDANFERRRKDPMRRTLSICLLALVAVSAPATAQTSDTATGAHMSVKTAALTIDGTSTMHDYTLSTTALKIVSTLATGATLLQPDALQTFELQIPVNSFTTEKDALKKKMLETIKADKHPAITFKMASYTVEPAADGHAVVLAKGALTVAGVEQAIDLTLEVDEMPGGVRVKGTRDLSMKDFGIKAPTMFMGMLKTNDKVTIKFEVQLSPAATASN